VGRQPYGQRDDGQERIGISRRWKDGATDDKEIINFV
jgi:hypothetical protein